MSQKILILVIAYNEEPYIMLERECRRTWASLQVQDVTTIFVHSSLRHNACYQDNNTLYVPGEEGIFNVGYKMLNAFSYCLDNVDFDYIYRTNLSSYVYQPGLFSYVKSLGENNVYKGAVGICKGIRFASGCGYLISKNLVRYIVEHKSSWNHSLIDDVALAQVLGGINVFPEPVKRIDILNNADLVKFNVETIGDCFHFRCKSDVDRTHDVRVMNMLHNYFHKQDLI